MVFLPVGRLGNEESVGPFWVQILKNIRIVKKQCSGKIKGDVGCDRTVFGINSDLFLIKFNSFFNKWSLDLHKKTINPLIPY